MRRMKRLGLIAGLTAALMLCGMFTGVLVQPARAVDLGDLLKIGGIILAVTAFGDQINSFINRTLDQEDAEAAGATKVVPIFSIGQGAYIGAAQVIGVPNNVRDVQGVAAVNADLPGNLEGTLLVPISTRRPGRSLDRVPGVGIGAIIDLRI